MTDLLTTALAAIAAATTLEDVDAIETRYLGRKGELTALLRTLAALTPEEKRIQGPLLQDARTHIESALTEKRAALAAARLKDPSNALDPTGLAPLPLHGTLHPITQFIREAETVFAGLGFSVAEGPEIEDIWHNFDAMNIPADHPARDQQDTLYLKNLPQNALRVHTSTVQARFAESTKPPFRIIAPGRVYRKDDFDASHSPVFHQIEGMMVDKDISFAHLKATVEAGLLALIGTEVSFRWRTSYFPFVEPGFELDITCTVCSGTGCPACKHTGWIEMGGAGLIHPTVLRNVGIDPTEWSGFAFGFGIDRMVMMRHKIKDIRLLYENDPRFLAQF